MPAVMDLDARPASPARPAPIREPSQYQKDIYAFDKSGRGSAMVNAVAGSGKTTTLVGCVERLPARLLSQTCVVAFNKHIADEFSAKLPDGVTCGTIHRACLQSVKGAIQPIDPDGWIDAYKYNKLCRTYYKLQGVNTYKNPEIEDGTVEFLRLAMLSRAPITESGLIDLMVQFGLTLPKDKRSGRGMALGDMVDALKTLLEWGLNGTPAWITDEKMRFLGATQTISFDDMLHYTLSMDLALPQYERVYADESQDFSRAQREIVFRMQADQGRMLFVGDPKQSIYAFAGADCGSFDRIKEEADASELPLSICYRCPADHVRLAQEIVPHIEARPGAPDGIVERIQRQVLVDRLEQDDMVLCRLTAPLVSLFFECVAAGKAAIMRGRDMGRQLARTVDSISRADRFQFAQFPHFSSNYRLQQLFVLTQKEDNEAATELFCDRMRAIDTIFMRAWEQGIRDEKQFRMFVEHMFSDESNCITLATVHRSKGLENRRVFLLRPELMPFPMARTELQIEQEWNLRYVALTRAQESLFFVEGDTD